MAESFGSDADRYDRARPRYPGALVKRMVADVRRGHPLRGQQNPGPDVVDVGCGTGIVARQFQAAGCRVLGVDPDARMADLARRHGLEVEVVAFEAWDSAGREFDAVVAGQAWHWVDPVAILFRICTRVQQSCEFSLLRSLGPVKTKGCRNYPRSRPLAA